MHGTYIYVLAMITVYFGMLQLQMCRSFTKTTLFSLYFHSLKLRWSTAPEKRNSCSMTAWKWNIINAPWFSHFAFIVIFIGIFYFAFFIWIMIHHVILIYSYIFNFFFNFNFICIIFFLFILILIFSSFS